MRSMKARVKDNHPGAELVCHPYRRCIGISFFRFIFLIFVVVGVCKGKDNGHNVGKNENSVDDDDDEDVTSEITTEDSIMMIGKVLEEQQKKQQQQKQNEVLHKDDPVDDGIFDPISPDASCSSSSKDGQEDCWAPPKSTLEEDVITIETEEPECSDAENSSLPDQWTENNQQGREVCNKKSKIKKKVVDKHWGSDEKILKMRDKLRRSPSSSSSEESNIHSSSQKNQNPHKANIRPPVFLMPGLASTRLVSWKFKQCKAHHPLLSDIKVQDYVWLNMNLLLQMATIDVSCWKACMTLGLNQTDGILEGSQEGAMENDANTKNDTSPSKSGCKLRPDEGLDAISSLAPGSISSELLVGGTNTVYAWLTQWLADNLGYDVGSIVGLPYDWRLSPDVMEDRDGFLTLTRRRLEAAVKTNGLPGIMVAHSMGNVIFRYFLEWLRNEMREEAYARHVKRAERRAAAALQQSSNAAVAFSETGTSDVDNSPMASSTLPGWMGGVPPHKVDFDRIADYIQNSESRVGNEGRGTNSRDDGKNDQGGSNGEDSGSSVGDRMYTFANSFVSGIDDLFRTYFPNIDDSKKSRNEGKDGAKSMLQSSSMYSAATSADDLFGTSNDGQRNDQQEQQENLQTEDIVDNMDDKNGKHAPLWELAQIEGDVNWIDWINDHIWTYVGLSAPLLGAINPLRAVLSGENMGLPITDEVARQLELSFGSTHTVNPISTKMGFCDNDSTNSDRSKNNTTLSKASTSEQTQANRANLACLDELVSGIENSRTKTALSQEDPWVGYNALRLLLKDRVDWDTDFPMIQVSKEQCKKSEKARPCAKRDKLNFGPQHVQNGTLFTKFHEIWDEEDDPLLIKREQLETSFWNTPFQNVLKTTWDRPHIKHVVMAYGVDVPTEVGYVYRKEEEYNEDHPATNVHSVSSANSEGKGSSESAKKEDFTKKKQYDGIPRLHKVIWEEANGKLMEIPTATKPTSITESFVKKKPKKQTLYGGDGNGKLHHSGDGTIPYLSLIWAHTWLLHATRAMRNSGHMLKEGERISDDNALDSILISHRPKGGSEWIKGSAKSIVERGEDPKHGKNLPSNSADDDTGTMHPHGTKYKPEMHRFQSRGKSRSTGMEYTTTVIEAIGVEHKETTRNYDILAAVFTDVLKYMHDDFGLV